jgi:predicted nucleotidyltransferase
MSASWPKLSTAHDEALRALVSYVHGAYDAVAIVVSGSIVRGNPDPRSDFDVFVIHREPWRLREQKRFHGVPAELFVNPPEALRRYMAGSEHASGRPSTAHMLATGCVVHAADPVVWELVAEARNRMTSPPVPTEEQLVRLRYEIADLLDDARDAAARDHVAAALLAGSVVQKTVSYAFRSRALFEPRRKDVATALADMDPEAGRLLGSYVDAPSVAAAEALVRHVVGVDTFFEWTSSRD